MGHPAAAVLALLLMAAPAMAGPLEVLIDGRSSARGTAVLPDTTGFELAPATEVTLDGVRYRRAAQLHAGVPVRGCGLETVLDADGHPVRVDARLCGVATAVPFAVGEETAAGTARAAVEARGRHDRLVVATPVAQYRVRGAETLVPVWRVDVATANPWTVTRVFVDGQTGRVRRVADIMLARAHGLVFMTPQNVVKNQATMRPLPGLRSATRLEGDAVILGDLTDYLAQCPGDDTLFCVPARVDSCSARGRKGRFVYPPSNQDTFGTCTVEDRFDQVTGYYHLAMMSEYFAKRVGWTFGSNTLRQYAPLPVLANVPGMANAFFAPPSDAWPSFLAFGDEFNAPQQQDFLRDPTVPRHELTHAAIYDTGSAVNDFLDCDEDQECLYYPGALHEGLADYFAIASMKPKTMSVLGGALGTGLAGVVRDLDNDLRWPCDLTGEVHDDGRIWAGFLYETRKLLGDRLDGFVFNSLLALPHTGHLQFGHALAALAETMPPLTEKMTLGFVQNAVRRGLIGPNSYDRSDDVIVDNADEAFTCNTGAFCGELGDDLQKEGDKAALVAVTDAFTTGVAAHHKFVEDDEDPVNVLDKPFLNAWVLTTRNIAAGELEIVLDDTDDCSSPVARAPIPAVQAGEWDEVFAPLDGDAVAITCVGLAVAADAGAVDVALDDIRAVAPVRHGSVVVPLQAGRKLGLKNRFPAPFGDSHFYYFRAPAGATRVSVLAGTQKDTPIPTDLAYCGSTAVSGTGKIEPELNSVLLWDYDPTRVGVFESALTPLPIDQHRLLTAVPATGERSRRLSRFPLPSSATGIYAVSIQGAGEYRLKLAFD